MTAHDTTFSRRAMLKGGSALVIGLYLGDTALAQSGAAQAFRPSGADAALRPTLFCGSAPTTS